MFTDHVLVLLVILLFFSAVHMPKKDTKIPQTSSDEKADNSELIASDSSATVTVENADPIINTAFSFLSKRNHNDISHENSFRSVSRSRSRSFSRLSFAFSFNGNFLIC